MKFSYILPIVIIVLKNFSLRGEDRLRYFFQELPPLAGKMASLRA
ncbi:hypothetical protein [Coxiella endosymbiont of Ornithodoros maritimus]|nr:hypothetical protein [Coxiella endosymbiont of Ornithodoros maritimus]